MFLFKIYDVQIGIDKLKDKSKFLEVNLKAFELGYNL